MKNIYNEEKKILESVEKGEWQSVSDLETVKSDLIQIAKNTSAKNIRINIKLSEKDLAAIKAKALEEGVSYQTLISSIIHKYNKGALKPVTP